MDCVFMPVLLDSLYCCQNWAKRKEEIERMEERRGERMEGQGDVGKRG